jgi:hypothetical protein
LHVHHSIACAIGAAVNAEDAHVTEFIPQQ